jgi:hypothetical protein
MVLIKLTPQAHDHNMPDEILVSSPYCTILTVGSQGVTCDGGEHYWTKFMGEN